MSVTPGDLAKEARALTNAARCNKARCRTVVGRAYYAAFHALLLAAKAAGYRYSKEDERPPGTHENLIVWCRKQKSVLSLPVAGRRLADLKVWRQRADYHLQVPITYDEALACLENAEAVIEDLGEDLGVA